MDAQKIESVAIRLKSVKDALELLSEHLEDECTPSKNTRTSLETMGACISSRVDMFVSLISLIQDCIDKQVKDLTAALKS